MPETQPRKPLTTAEAVAAALMVYADAIKLGQVPAPQYINLHAAGLPRKTFMTLADQLGAPIRIVPGAAYAEIELPFGAGLLPSDIHATAHATTSVDDALRRDIEVHNSECVPTYYVPAEATQ